MTALKKALQYYPGQRKEIVIGAPHHGYRPGCDYNTKEVASLLAKNLGANLIVGDHLRPIVDLNKDPDLAATQELKQLCLDYQSYALAEEVELFVEIHGHIHGHYDIELSCGFEFDPKSAFDKEFAERLASLKENLTKELSRVWQKDFFLPLPSLGLFPFDHDVVMKARKTYLFQKIRVLQQKGRKIYGLHIEVFRDYKTNTPSSPIFPCQVALTETMAKSLSKTFSLSF